MKTEDKKTGWKGLPLRDHRWQWMTAGAAGAAAGVTAAQAGTVTVPLSNNYISAAAGIHLNLDLAGDGVHNNLTLSNEQFSSFSSLTTQIDTITTHGPDHVYLHQHEGAFVDIDGKEAVAIWSSNDRFPFPDDLKFSNGFGNEIFDTQGPNTFAVDFTFSGDPAINDGASTPATLTFETIADGPGDVEVKLVSYTYTFTYSFGPLALLEAARQDLVNIFDLFPAIRDRAVRPDIVGGFTPLEIAGLRVDEDMEKVVDPRNFQAGGNLLNPARGEDVFQYCNNVVETLLPYSRGDSAFAGEVRGIIENITQADIEFADNAYTAASGLSTYQVDNVTEALDDADNAESDGLFLEAISEAQAAWRYVNMP